MDTQLSPFAAALVEQLGIEVWVCRSGTGLAARVCDAEGYDSELALEDAPARGHCTTVTTTRPADAGLFFAALTTEKYCVL